MRYSGVRMIDFCEFKYNVQLLRCESDERDVFVNLVAFVVM